MTELPTLQALALLRLCESTRFVYGLRPDDLIGGETEAFALRGLVRRGLARRLEPDAYFGLEGAWIATEAGRREALEILRRSSPQDSP